MLRRRSGIYYGPLLSAIDTWNIIATPLVSREGSPRSRDASETLPIFPRDIPLHNLLIRSRV